MAKLADVKRRKKGFAGPPMARKGRTFLAACAQRTGSHLGRRQSQREDVGMLLEQLAVTEALLDYCRR